MLDREFKEHEKRYQNILFTKIQQVIERQNKVISLMSESAESVGLKNIDLKNIGITLNNKIIELQHIFENAGISIYSSKKEKYGIVDISFVGNSIINDLLSYIVQSNNCLLRCEIPIKSAKERNEEQIKALENTSPIKRFLAKIKSFFVSSKQSNQLLNEKELAMFYQAMKDYENIDKKLYEYSLENNLVDSIVRIVKEYHAFNVPRLLDEYVIPDLKKLELDSLIPKLKKALVEQYTKYLPDPEICEITKEERHLYVPEFKDESERDM